MLLYTNIDEMVRVCCCHKKSPGALQSLGQVLWREGGAGRAGLHRGGDHPGGAPADQGATQGPRYWQPWDYPGWEPRCCQPWLQLLQEMWNCAANILCREIVIIFLWLSVFRYPYIYLYLSRYLSIISVYLLSNIYLILYLLSMLLSQNDVSFQRY